MRYNCARQARWAWHFGDLSKTRVLLVRLTATVYVVADHRIKAINTVWVDDVPTTGYALRVETREGSTRPVTLIEFSAPIAQDQRVAAAIQGFVDGSGRSVELAEDVATVIEHGVLAQIIGVGALSGGVVKRAFASRSAGANVRRLQKYWQQAGIAGRRKGLPRRKL
jgi:hypothetical protein